MCERIKEVKTYRDELIKHNTDEEILMKFDAMLNSYKRKMEQEGREDITESQVADFYRIFILRK